MSDILRELLLESNENLAQLDLDLVTLEKEPCERETLARATLDAADALALPR